MLKRNLKNSWHLTEGGNQMKSYEVFWSQDKKDYQLNNCPFCGSAVLNIFKRDSKDDSPDIEARVISFYVHCENCGANGPPNLDRIGAANSWNKSILQPNPLEEEIRKNKK